MLKDSYTRSILLRRKFYFPEPSLQKIDEYREFILKKTGMRENELILLIRTLLEHIILVSEREMGSHTKRAVGIMGGIDREDVGIIAAALSKNAIIWSDDKHFEQQQAVPVLKTKDMKRYLDAG